MTSIMIDPMTGAPYVPLPPPFSEYRLTLPSLQDAGAIFNILRHGTVACMLSSVPEPYSMSDATDFLARFKAPVLERLQDVHWTDPEQVASALKADIPFTAIRDGACNFVGDLGIRRNAWEWLELEDPEKRQALIKDNTARPDGDSEISYSIGYYLSPQLQSKGLMTAALGVSINHARQYMGARHFQGICRQDNPASRRVLQKNGLEYTTEAVMPWKGSTWKVSILDFVCE